MKTCPKCQLRKSEDEFYKTYKATSYCKNCQRQYTKKWNRLNREILRTNQQRQRQEKRKLMVEYLKTHPCVDCGEKDILVLEFDHRDPKDKSSGIGPLLHGYNSWKVVLQEIEKCDVRCCNCHRRRTSKQQNCYRLQFIDQQETNTLS